MIESASPTTNIEQLADIIDVVQIVQDSLEDTGFEEAIYSKFTANNENMRQKLGWTREINATTWANQEIEKTNKILVQDDDKYAIIHVEDDKTPAELAKEIDTIFTDDIDDYEEVQVNSLSRVKSSL